jgi:deazaflavin-dependent oxidoreductase (nitroreductase family)
MPLIDFSRRPTGWLKRVLRWPVYLYRARLGFLFGRRFLMIEHRGRRTGRHHRTVVEVAGRRSGEWVCASGTGPRSDWYRNLRAGGLLAVWVGSRKHWASVRFLDAREAAGVMGDYEHEHPRTAARLYGIMGVSYDGTVQGRVEMMEKVPMVALKISP